MKILLILVLFLVACTTTVIEDDVFDAESVGDKTFEEEIIEAPEIELEDCVEKPKYSYPPVNLDKTKVMVPFGLMTGNHVTPIDHQYFQDFSNTEVDIEVYSPEKGAIIGMQHMSGSYYDSKAGTNIDWADFRLVIRHPCEIESTYIHIDELTPKIMAFAPAKGQYSSVNIPVEAGELIGYYSQNVDYNLVDYNFELEGFVNPETYVGEPWKVHVPNTLDYFEESIANKMSELCLSHTTNSCGKFDRDIDGTLQGNWFEEGTNGYAQENRDAYWKTHISFSPDHLDDSYFIVSLGEIDGREGQFGTSTNSPFPSEVTTETGLVKYSLTGYDYFVDGEYWDRSSLAKNIEARSNTEARGTVLVQMISDDKLKFEAFTTDEDSFTTNAKIYER